MQDWHEHGEFLRRLARNLVDHHSAEDLAQDAWLATRAKGPSRPRARRAWLGRVLRNLALNLRRGTRRRIRRERSAARPEAVASADEVQARLELQGRIVALVNELEEPYRTTVYLRFYEGLPPREIARREDLSVHTVKTRLQRALASLGGRLDGEFGGFRSAWCAVLLPLTSPGRPLVPAVPSAAVIGGITVKTAAVIGFAAFAVLLALFYRPRDPVPSSLPARTAGAEPVQDRPEVEPTGASTSETDRRALSRESPGAIAAESDWIVSGRVVDPSGSPIAGARIEAALDPSRAGVATTSDEDGAYQLTLDLPDGISDWASMGISAEASAAGYGSEEQRRPNLRRFDQRGQEVSFDFTLKPQRHARGLVMDAEGAPVDGALVALIDETGKLRSSGQTGVDGAFLSPVGAGARFWLVAGSAESGTALTGPHEMPDDTDLDLGSTALAPHGVLEGTLTRPDGTPIPDMPIRARLIEADPGVGTLFDAWLDEAGETGAPPPRAFAGHANGATRSDDHGRFRLDGLAPGRYELELPELARWSDPPRMGPYRTGERASVTVESYRLHVRVVDQQGLAVPGADLTVRKLEAGAWVTSSRGMDADGTFAPDPGTWVITASLEGARPAERTLEVVAGVQEYDAELVLDFEPATGEIRVLVTDGRRLSVAAFEVNLWLQDSSVMVADFRDLTPDTEGVLPPIPTGSYQVRVTFPSQPRRSVDPRRPSRLGDHFSVNTFATVRKGERSTLRLTTHRGGRLYCSIAPEVPEHLPVSVVIRDVLGGQTRRITALTEKLAAGQSRSSATVLGASGFSSLIEPGTYVLRATAEGFEDFERTIDVRPGEATELRIHMQTR